MIQIRQYTETEEQIFEAALGVFSEKGKDGARMQEIADRAGINKAMLHYYFRSKDGLYKEVFDYVFRRFMLSIGEAIEEAETFETTLRIFIDRYVSFHREHPAVMRLWIHENLAGGTVVKEKIRQGGADLEMAPPLVFMRKMQQAIDVGEIRAVDPFHTFVTILGSVVFFFLTLPVMSVLNPALAADLEAAIEARKAHVFGLIYNGLRPEPAPCT